MYKEDLGTDNSSPEIYRYTEDGGFVKVNDSGKMTSDGKFLICHDPVKRTFIVLRGPFFVIFDEKCLRKLVPALLYTFGTRCRSVDSLPLFTADITEISLHSSEAVWYRIGKDMSGKSIVAERPDNVAQGFDKKDFLVI